VDRGWRRLRVAEVVCQNFADELSFTFTVRWRGGKARTIFLRAPTALLGVQQTSALVFDSWGGRPYLCRLVICTSQTLFLPRAYSFPDTNRIAIKSTARPAVICVYVRHPSISFMSDLCKRRVIILPPRPFSLNYSRDGEAFI
jgi:hypothetical protein